MKKKIFPTLIICVVLLFTAGLSTSCKDDIESTRVEITVKALAFVPASGVTVYAFVDPTDHNRGHDPKYAKQSAITDKNGVAVFDLNNLTDLNFLHSQTTLYFTVLKSKGDGEYEIAGTVSLTVTKNKTAKKELLLAIDM